jgi:hypothetical protein
MSSDAEILPPPAGDRAGAHSIGLALMGVVFIDRLAIGANARVFTAAVEHALWFQVGVFGLAFLLMLALPARRGHNPPTPSV